jgi:hypothetical protein
VCLFLCRVYVFVSVVCGGRDDERKRRGCMVLCMCVFDRALEGAEGNLTAGRHERCVLHVGPFLSI